MNLPNLSTRHAYLAALLLASCIGAGRASLAQPVPPVAAAPNVTVTTVKADRRDVPQVLRGIGNVQAFQNVLLRSRVDGAITAINFTEGQDVKAGDVLVQIDPRPYRAALDQATAKKAADAANLVDAKLDLARYRDTAARGIEPQQKLDSQVALVGQLQASIESDDAAIAAAQLNLTYSTIIAPIDGHVGLRQIDIGNIVHASDPSTSFIVSIAQIHPIAVTFALPQENLPLIQRALAVGGAPVEAYTSDGTTLLSKGALQTIDNTVDATTGTIKLKAVFANTDNKLWPGGFVNAALTVGITRDVVALPSRAVQYGPAGRYVYTVGADSSVAITPVEVARDDGTTSVIAKGLSGGETVVLTNQAKLQNGVHVAARPAENAS